MDPTTEASTNGATPPTTATEAKSDAPKKEKPVKAKKPKAEKKAAAPKAPKAKKEKKAKAPKKAKAVKAAAAPKAKKPSKKLAGGKLHKYPSADSPIAERRAATERTQTFMKATAKREEPNDDEAKLWRSIKVGSETDTAKMAELFPGASAKRRSRVRNALRWLRAARKFKKLPGKVKGRYERIA